MTAIDDIERIKRCSNTEPMRDSDVFETISIQCARLEDMRARITDLTGQALGMAASLHGEQPHPGRPDSGPSRSEPHGSVPTLCSRVDELASATEMLGNALRRIRHG